MAQHGRSLPVSFSRRMVIDYLRASENRALITVSRILKLGPLEEARRASLLKPGWSALFIKAYAILSERNPELRRLYLSYPRPRFYEHPHPIACVIVEREYRGESTVLPGLLHNPQLQSLGEIEAWLTHVKTAPIMDVASFRRALFICKFPWPVSKIIWHVGTRWWGSQQVAALGTFGISSLGYLGAALENIVTPWTSGMHPGCVEPDGRVAMRITFEHRVLDGAPVARMLADLEKILLGEILQEVKASPSLKAA